MQKLVEAIEEEDIALRQKNIIPVMLVDYRIRKPLVKLLEPFGINISILGNAEIDSRIKFEVVGTLNIQF